MLQIKLSRLFNYWFLILLAMAMNIIPWRVPLLNIMPDWVLLVLIYWAIIAPEVASVGKAWLVGLLIDALTGQLLGEYALVYATSVFLAEKQHKRIRQFPLIQQSLVVGVILFCSRVLVFWLEQINGQILPLSFWLPVVSGTVIWPLVFIVLSKIRA